MLQGEYAYLGLLDDFALRHNLKASCIKDVKSLNQVLIIYAMIGERLLIGDGYLIMHPAAQQAILNQQYWYNSVNEHFK